MRRVLDGMEQIDNVVDDVITFTDAMVAAPLTDLLKKEASNRLQWECTQDIAFSQLKAALSQNLSYAFRTAISSSLFEQTRQI